MVVTIALLHKDKIYHTTIQSGKTVSIGSHKKDDVFVEGFSAGQVVVKWRKNGFWVSAKKAYNFEKDCVPLDTLIMLDDTTNTVLLLNSQTSQSEQKIELPYNCILKFGRSDDNDVIIKIPFISSYHFVLKNESGKVRIEDQNSTNGLYLNGKKVSIAKMKSGDTVSIFSVKIKLLNGVLYFENVADKLILNNIDFHSKDNTSHSVEQENKLIYRRSPRTQEQLPYEDIVLASPPTKAQKFEKGRGMFSSLIGSSAMLATSMVTTAASPALLAARAASLVYPVTSIASSSGANKKKKKSLEQYEAMRREKYGAYIEDQKARINSVAKVQRDIITRENPEPRVCFEDLFMLKRNLWERMPSDRDFLDVRIGMGYENLCVNVKSRNDNSGFQMDSDEIRELSEQIIEETRIVDNVPARLSLLKKNTVGFVGNRTKTINLVKNMIVSLATSHCFEDVRIIGIFDEDEREHWESIKWLPHIWDDNHQFRTLAFNHKDAHDLCELFDDILKKRKEELKEHSYSKTAVPRPFYIFIFGSKDMVEKEQIMHNLFVNNPAMGATSLFLFDDLYMLPHECSCIVDVDNGPCVYDRNETNNKFYFTQDHNLDEAQWDKFARRMSAITLDGFAAKSSLPNSVSFLQGYGARTVEQLDIYNRWNSAQPYKSLAARIGILTGDKLLNFDLHEKKHGPHGLVAGTTGSGKSELLITWILSMCVSYHPEDVNFVLIDYKGGGMAKPLEELPHVVGIITNIDSNIERALVSLNSELKRRERIFLNNFPNDKINIYDYQKAYKNGKVKEPLPHLIIVADEFAELKREKPQFMQDLNSIARLGRELGVHLILATQKPGGIVDDQIRSNSRFQWCMKVADVADSREMIKRPDAAKITNVGRSYIRVGEDEYFDLFQSFWSGAPYFGLINQDESTGNQLRIVDVTGKRIKTFTDDKTRYVSDVKEMKAVVEHICKVAKEHNVKKLVGPWLPELPQMLYLDDIKAETSFDGCEWGSSSWLKLPVGKYDSPVLQSQGELYIDFADEGHYGIYGAPGTGKTTMLKTVVMSLGMHYSPKDVSIYILDCGGWSMSVFSNMPHVGGIALDCEDEKFSKFEKLILREFERRKKIFLKNAVSSLKAYRESISSDMPAIVIAIDNIVPIFDLYPELESLFVTIAREGATFGIYLIYTANSTSGVRYKVLQNIRGAIAFELTDKGDYATVVGRLDGTSLPKVLGRALLKGNPPLVFQAAIYAKGESDRERTMSIKDITTLMNANWSGFRPLPIPVLPEEVTKDDMLAEYSVRTRIPVGVNSEDIRTAYFDLSDNYSLLITGTMGSGKSALLSRIVGLIAEGSTDSKLYVIDSKSKSLSALRSISHKYASVLEDDLVSDMFTELVDHLNERKRNQNKARQVEGESFNEREFISSYDMLCIVVDDLKEFVDCVSDANKNTMERICRMAQNLGVIVLCSGRMTDIAKYNEIESLTRVIVGNQNGLVTDGTPVQHSYFQNNLKYSQRDIEPGENLSYMFVGGKCMKIKLMR